MMMNTRERTIQRLLQGLPKPRPYGRLIDGKFWKGHLSQHRTKQGVALGRFLRMKRFIQEYRE